MSDHYDLHGQFLLWNFLQSRLFVTLVSKGFNFSILFFFRKLKSTNLKTHEHVNIAQTTKIDTHELKYFHSIHEFYFSGAKFV